jgi:glutaredoxin-related protein
MNYQTYKENTVKVVIWSKNGCTYCEKAKALLKSKEIAYEERNINTSWTKEQLLEAVPNARTVPQIFIDDELIGGFDDLAKKLAA